MSGGCNTIHCRTSAPWRACWRGIRAKRCSRARPSCQQPVFGREPARTRHGRGYAVLRRRGLLIGFGVSIAHKADVGGSCLIFGCRRPRNLSRRIHAPPVRFATADGTAKSWKRFCAVTAVSPTSCWATCAVRSGVRGRGAATGRLVSRVRHRHGYRRDASDSRADWAAFTDRAHGCPMAKQKPKAFDHDGVVLAATCASTRAQAATASP